MINLDVASGNDNPSSLHSRGVLAAAKLAEARKLVASVLGGLPDEIIFTSGGTEANNLAILGVVKAIKSSKKSHIITLETEHASVLEPCRALERAGFDVTYLGVNPDGLLDLKEFKKALRPETILVSISYVNNEIGVIQPIKEISKIIRSFKKLTKLQANEATSSSLLHTDACQAPQSLDLNVARLGVDLMTLNSSKINGPKGVGCLYIKRRVALEPIVYGGGQERGLRSGTENVPAIANFAKALTLAVKKQEKESVRLTKLRDYFIKKLLKFDGVTLNGSATARVANNVNVSFAGTDSEYIVLSLDAKGVLASSGSACSTRAKDSSYGVRFTLNHKTKKSDLDYVLKILPEILHRARVEL